MQYCDYLGNPAQLAFVEEHRLVGGKGDGMRLFEVNNGQGLNFTVSADRAADISRLSFMGRNMNFFSPCGYVAPSYYKDWGEEWVKSFTAGFLTTCGLTAVGSPCTDEGEELPLHGTIANIPAEHIWWHEEKDALVIEADIADAAPFCRKLRMHRKIEISKVENKLTLTDTVENHGEDATPMMILYHMNMGYPLVSENAILDIPSINVTPRDDHAANNIGTWKEIPKPADHYQEQCFFHKFNKQGKAKLYNPDIGLGLAITFDADVLSEFCQWKMFGKHDYVLGLEPGNCTPEGRDVLRKKGTLQFLQPGESKSFSFTVTFCDNKADWDKA